MNRKHEERKKAASACLRVVGEREISLETCFSNAVKYVSLGRSAMPDERKTGYGKKGKKNMFDK